MIQFFENDRSSGETWRGDPLSHPDIAAMTPRELADLPFEPFALPPEEAGYPARAGRYAALRRTLRRMARAAWPAAGRASR